MKAEFNKTKGLWEVKYEFKSKQKPVLSRLIRGGVSGDGLAMRGGVAGEITSDYGTMSNQQMEEQNLEDLIPGLNLTEDGAETVFNEVSIEERKERIDSILSEIMAVPRLSEAVLTQRSLTNQAKLRRYLSSETVSSRSSAMSGKVSARLTQPRSNPSLQRCSSSPRLHAVKETGKKGQPPPRTEVVSLKGLLVPNLNLSGLNVSTGTKSDQKSNKEISRQLFKPKPRSLGHSISDSQQRIDMENFKPALGEDTQDELMIIPPTLGDDTTQIYESFGDSMSVDGAEVEPPPRDSGPTNYILENMRSSSTGTSRRSPARDRPEASPPVAKHKSGRVPKYLKARQQQWRDEAQAAIDNTPDPDCPPGCRRLPEEDRVLRLEEMRRTHTDLLADMNRLPVSADTRRVQLRRKEIESLLVQMEEGIRTYSRPKVFLEQI